MPELPEVETLARSLTSLILGLRFEAVRFYRRDLRDPIPVEGFKKALLGHTVSHITRRSKYLVIETHDGGCGIFHLGMSGQMLHLAQGKPELPHTHLVMTFSEPGGEQHFIHFVDPRRFGRIHFSQKNLWDDHPLFQKLGPEPLDQKNLGLHLFRKGKTSTRTVKSLIMDSGIVTGVGNIYACESLFLASVHPLTPSNKLSEVQWSNLGKAIKDTLRKAIKAGGTTIKDFKQMNGQKGYFAIQLNMYGRDGQDCPQCQKSISVLKISGRNTWFCENCQKLN